MELKNIDIFCEIIDNYGDIGVVYRLAHELYETYDKKIKIRVFLNRIDEFLAINKKAKKLEIQEITGISYITFDYLEKNIDKFKPSSVIIEAFGCNISNIYMEKAYFESDLLINLEYLSAEDWIEDFHLMSSPIGKGKLKKIFFMPGFTQKSGGIIIDDDYIKRIENVKNNYDFYKNKYLSDIDTTNKLVGTIFSYEKNFENLLKNLEELDKNIVLLAMGSKTQESIKKILKKNQKNIIEVFGNTWKYGKIDIVMYDFLNQEEYEELINLVDFNFVRGEDSFIRAVLTGKPYIWHIYCQDEYTHLEKLDSFLDKYERIVKNDENIKYLQEIRKLFKDYNFRLENNLDKSNENYLYFFNNFDKITMYNEIFRDYLIENCNLINKLKKYIENI